MKRHELINLMQRFIEEEYWYNFISFCESKGYSQEELESADEKLEDE